MPWGDARGEEAVGRELLRARGPGELPPGPGRPVPAGQMINQSTDVFDMIRKTFTLLRRSELVISKGVSALKYCINIV